MTTDQPPPTSKIPDLLPFERWLLVAVIIGAFGVGALGLLASFDTVGQQAQEWGFKPFWILPVAVDIAIPVFSLAHLLLIRADMPLGWVRAVPWALTAVTMYLNVSAAGNSLAAQIGHGALPLLWVVCSEIAAHVYRALIGAVTGRRMERVRKSRWILSPFQTFFLWRRMILWEVTSYRTALALERERRMIRAGYRQEHGRGWRKKVTRQQLVRLRMGELAPAEVDANNTAVAVDNTAVAVDNTTEAVDNTTEAVATSPKHVICTGFYGTLFLRRPLPIKTAAPTKPAGPEGARVRDLATVLSGQHAPVVYFICNGDRVKIGTTTSLRARVRRLCLRIEDIALVQHGGQVYERQLHERFADYRIGDTEWFELAGQLAAYVAGKHDGGDSLATTGATVDLSGDKLPTVVLPAQAPPPPAEEAGDSSSATPDDIATVGDSSPTAPDPAGDSSAPAPSGKRRKRRPMDEWVELAGPIFTEEFHKRRKQPNAREFADAIELAGYGAVSESTAKNIRTAILDHAGVELTSTSR